MTSTLMTVYPEGLVQDTTGLETLDNDPLRRILSICYPILFIKRHSKALINFVSEVNANTLVFATILNLLNRIINVQA